MPAATAALPSQPVWQQRHAGLQYALYAPLPGSRVHALRIELDRADIRLALTDPAQRGQVLPAMTGARQAWAAVNGSFFDRDFTPRGLTVSDGVAWQSVLAAQHSPLLACDAKHRCAMHLQAPFALLPQWHTVVAGTPWLVAAGEARTDVDDAACPDLCAAPHPRTALGLDATQRTLIIMVAEGRRPGMPGLRLSELARAMRALGAHQALNLDGGGSSVLMLDGDVFSQRPANEPAPRAIANALLIRAAD